MLTYVKKELYLFSFIPEDVEEKELETVMITLDEFETIRLLDYEGLNQEVCASRMGVARTTVTAIYESARKKLIGAIVEGKRICIAGGNIEIDREKNILDKKIKEKGVNVMRVAVTYDNGNVFGHFGRTEEFKVYDIEDGKVVNAQILGTNGEGCGCFDLRWNRWRSSPCSSRSGNPVICRRQRKYR